MTLRQHILLVEDDPDLARGLVDAVELEGFHVTHVAEGKAALTKALTSSHDLIILDVMLPGLSGFDLLRELRVQGNRTPVLMLTAKSEETDKVRGLRLGADDYMTKPFGIMELVARIEALLRRVERHPSKPSILETARIRVDFNARKAWRKDRPAALTEREFQILETLAQRRGEAVSRDDLLTRIWGLAEDVEVSTRTVDQHIAALRRKLGDDAAEPTLIETVYGHGYRLAAPTDET